MHKSILNSDFLLQQKKKPTTLCNIIIQKGFFYPFLVDLETSHIKRKLFLNN